MVSCNNCQREVTFILKHLAKSTYCKNSYSKKDILDLRKASREKTLSNQRVKQNQSYDSGKRSKKYHEEKQRKSKAVKQNNSNTVTEVKSNSVIQSSNEEFLEEPCYVPTSNLITEGRSNLIQSSNEDFFEEQSYVWSLI